jgi:hypothetical protein
MEEVGRDVCRLVQEALDNITPDSALKQLWILFVSSNNFEVFTCVTTKALSVFRIHKF